MKFKMDAAAEKRLKESIKRQVGEKAEKIVGDLFEDVLKATPMNTGRTLASWTVSRGSPSNYDANDEFYGAFEYNPDEVPATNDLPVGMEPGRAQWEQHARNSMLDVEIGSAPYDKFYIANGAEVDSMFTSSLAQGPGSRAAHMEYGRIPGYDVYADQQNVFDPRGHGFFMFAIMKFLSKVRRR